jgi:hypothetical protein
MLILWYYSYQITNSSVSSLKCYEFFEILIDSDLKTN